MTRVHDTWADTDTPIVVELYYSGGWHDVSADLGKDGVEITRGRSAEGGDIDPAEMTLTLNNEAGKYSPRNPASVLYGLIGRNTPIRVSVTINSVTYVRFTGEVVSWPQEWTTKGTAYTPIECAGVMRRIGQGARPLESVYRRGCTSPVAPVQDLVAYWPMEDAAGSTSLASGIPGGRAATIIGSPGMASDDSFTCSAPLPVMTSGAAIVAPVPAYAATGEWQVWMLVKVPEAGVSSDTRIMLVTSTGSAARWAVVVTPAGSLEVLVEDADLGVLDTYGPVAFAVNGKLVRLMLQAEQDGADVGWALSTLEVGQSTGLTSSLQTIAGVTCGQVSAVVVGPDRNLDGTVPGHLSVQSQITSIFVLDELLHAYQGETTAARVERLAGEEGLAITVTGATSQRLGGQGVATLTDLLAEAADVDQGLLFEPRDSDDLAYRTMASLCTQDPTCTIAYTDNLLIPFRPVEDDQRSRNMVTIARDGGSSSTVEVTAGPLSTQAPPDGIGIYPESLTLSLEADWHTRDQAGWRAHLGTVDEARWPHIGIELAHPTLRADDALTAAVLALDLGDRLVVTDPPAWLPPGDVDQLVHGYTEKITPTRYKITLVCVPYSPYRVGVWDDTGSRWGADGVVLAEDLTTTETGVDITSPAGVTWTHADGDYDVLVGGERMTVTAVSGTGTSQTLTVTRSANGVVKTHSSGAAVVLAEPSYYGRND